MAFFLKVIHLINYFKMVVKLLGKKGLHEMHHYMWTNDYYYCILLYVFLYSFLGFWRMNWLMNLMSCLMNISSINNTQKLFKEEKFSREETIRGNTTHERFIWNAQYSGLAKKVFLCESTAFDSVLWKKIAIFWLEVIIK